MLAVLVNARLESTQAPWWWGHYKSLCGREQKRRIACDISSAIGVTTACVSLAAPCWSVPSPCQAPPFVLARCWLRDGETYRV